MKVRASVSISCLALVSSVGLAQTNAPIDFAREVQPVLRARCYGCHGAQQQMNGLRLDRKEDALRGGYSGAVIRPGDAAGSKLYQAVTQGISVAGGTTLRMPPAGGALSQQETDVIRRWIEQGASWPAESSAQSSGAGKSAHWSFQPVRRPAVPAAQAGRAKNPVDNFILAKLEKRGLQPSAEAPTTVLLRRLYLDLTGLPPSEEEQAAYLADQRPDAYERLVERLLASPHYGEKWARQWLDLARYADSEGGVHDFARPYAWRYREWVIQALNRDLPFDQFTVEQVAGDLLPRVAVSQKIAAGFHRNTVTSREGGIDLERLRYEQLVDRTNTVSTVWLGLTAGCAQCHDHKYDPISQKDYYSLMAFFENTVELDVEAPLPGELGPYRQYIGQYRAQRGKLLEEYKVAPVEAEWEEGLRDAAANPGKRPNWDVAYDVYSKGIDNGPRILQRSAVERTTREQDAVVDFFVRSGASGLGKQRYEELRLKELDEKLKALREKYPPLSLAMTVAEDSQPIATHIRLRGNYKDKGIAVTPGTPAALPPLPSGEPVNRLVLARWLVSRDNPLTARVAVNRVWQELFGKGIVRTVEDFGLHGEPPSHPELLDWLAAEFMDHGWSMKHIVRLLVTSATYRQSSNARPDLALDPANALLARQSRFRLPAELIRDSALQAGGLLLDTIGGESVRPPQPEGIADLQYSMKWDESTGRSRYRRGLYIYVQRTAAYPLLMNFDAPDRTVSCTRRETSNTPLQALNLMNDPVFAEAAQALAARVLQSAHDTAGRIDHAFRICYARPASPKERDLLLSYLERRRQLAREHPQALDSMSTADLPGVDPLEAVAWFGASRALLNSDEFLTRE